MVRADYTFHITFIGDENTGKTTAAQTLLRSTSPHVSEHMSRLPTTLPTIGIDYTICRLCAQGQNLKVCIWDTAGQERFRSIVSTCYRPITFLVLFFDVTRAASFEKSVPAWIDDIRQSTDAPIALVGNKTDQPRQVPEQVARDFARAHGATYYELSSRTPASIHQMLESECGKILKKLHDGTLVDLEAYHIQDNTRQTNRTSRDPRATSPAVPSCCILC